MRCTETKSITKRAKTVIPISDIPNSIYWTMNDMWSHYKSHGINRVCHTIEIDRCKGFKIRMVKAYGKSDLKVSAVWPNPYVWTIGYSAKSSTPISKIPK